MRHLKTITTNNNIVRERGCSVNRKSCSRVSLGKHGARNKETNISRRYSSSRGGTRATCVSERCTASVQDRRHCVRTFKGKHRSKTTTVSTSKHIGPQRAESRRVEGERGEEGRKKGLSYAPPPLENCTFPVNTSMWTRWTIEVSACRQEKRKGCTALHHHHHHHHHEAADYTWR